MALRTGELRYWGHWTRDKLDILRGYLNEFTTAGKNKSEEFIYLDLFAGRIENIQSYFEEKFDGSTIIALKTNNPPFTRLRFFEKEHFQELQEGLKDYKDRDVIVIPGNCNEKIYEVLRDLSEYSWAPSFAFIDPNGPDCHWATLEALANFRKSARGLKTEIFLLFPHAMFTRLLTVNKTLSTTDAHTITQMFGNEEWRNIYEARRSKQFQPDRAREEYINLMRWKLKNQLGYKWTHPLEFYTVNRHPLYSLIFATDHFAGDKIISHLYNQALKTFPKGRERAKEMREINRKKNAGEQALFDLRETPGTEPQQSNETYSYEPPWDPYQPL